MKSKIGVSQQQNLSQAISEAAQGLTNPTALIVMTSYDHLAEASKLLAERFPAACCIGTSGTAFALGKEYKDRLVLVAFTAECEATAGVITHLSTCPMLDIYSLRKNLEKVNAGTEDTVCIEFCTGFEERLVTTFGAGLHGSSVGLIGGTVFGCPDGITPAVACNGQVYEDSCAYLLLKNTNGRAKIYRENIYSVLNHNTHIATRVNLAQKRLLQLDYRPAAEVYSRELQIPREKIVGNVLQNPLGRVVGENVYIASMYQVDSDGSMLNYKRINENDTIQFMQLQDYAAINQQTLRTIKQDFSNISAVFSVDCIYRYLLFTQRSCLPTYLMNMAGLGCHAGIVGGGEQFGNQHVNQTMVCAVFGN